MPIEVQIALLLVAVFIITIMLIVTVIVLLKLTADVQKFGRLLRKVRARLKQDSVEGKH